MSLKTSRAWSQTEFIGSSLAGDSGFHLLEGELKLALAHLNEDCSSGTNTLESMVLRGVDGVRRQPQQALLTVDGGLIGDRWSAGKAKPGDQISMMNLDVACVIANGQSVVLFGDNLFTTLDLREEHLLVGTRLQIGEAVLKVSATPHVPCGQFKARFGAAAFECAARDPRIRGVYLTVMESGTVRLGDAITPLD